MTCFCLGYAEVYQQKLCMKLINKTPPGSLPCITTMDMNCATAWVKSEVFSVDVFVNYAN